MQENILQFLLVQCGFHQLQLAGHIFLESFQICFVVMVCVLGGVIHPVIGHIIGFPKLVALDDTAVYGVAHLLVTVVLVTFGRLDDFLLRDGGIDVHMNVALLLLDTQNNAFQILQFCVREMSTSRAFIMSQGSYS